MHKSTFRQTNKVTKWHMFFLFIHNFFFIITTSSLYSQCWTLYQISTKKKPQKTYKYISFIHSNVLIFFPMYKVWRTIHSTMIKLKLNFYLEISCDHWMKCYQKCWYAKWNSMKNRMMMMTDFFFCQCWPFHISHYTHTHQHASCKIEGINHLSIQELIIQEQKKTFINVGD